MDLVLTLLIGLLIFYLIYKKFCKKKISKKEEYTDPVQTVIDEMKKKIVWILLENIFTKH